jgi:hypothetical protein
VIVVAIQRSDGRMDFNPGARQRHERRRPDRRARSA